MLSPNEIFIGKLANSQGLTLLLPSNSRESDTALIADVGEEKHVFFLGGQNKFSAFECTGNPHHGGILIPNVRIEFCVQSVVDEYSNWKAGTLVRAENKLYVASREQHFSGTYLVPLLDALPDCVSRCKAGFSKWQIVIGEESNKRVLHTISL